MTPLRKIYSALPIGLLLGIIPAVFYLNVVSELTANDLLAALPRILFLILLSVLVLASFLRARTQTVHSLLPELTSLDASQAITAVVEIRHLVIWMARGSGAIVATAAAMEFVFSGQSCWLFVVFTVAPMTAILVSLLAVRPAHAVMELLASRVPPERALGSLRATARRSIRWKWVTLISISVVLPTALLGDACRRATAFTLARMTQFPIEKQVEVARSLLGEGALKVLLLAASLFFLAFLAASLMGLNLAAPMRRIANQADRMSKGLLTEVHVVAAEGELVDLSSAFSRVQAHLKQVLNQLGNAGDSITATTDQLLTTSTHYEAGATDQATSLNETSSTTEELAQSARHISANSAEVSALAEKTLEAALNGQRSAEAFVTSVERMRHDNTSIHDAVTRLQKRVQQIGRIVEFITSVADRSDLLALSAELEGTKGGEVGRGFTLVAAEMRRLAENVIESTNEIEELIAEIREATLATVAATTSGSDQVTHGTRMASEVNSSLKTVVSLASTTSDAARSISLATQQQQTSTDQLAETMSDILGITQQSLAATKQVALANQVLLTLSGELKSMVQRLEGEPDRNIA